MQCTELSITYKPNTYQQEPSWVVYIRNQTCAHLSSQQQGDPYIYEGFSDSFVLISKNSKSESYLWIWIPYQYLVNELWILEEFWGHPVGAPIYISSNFSSNLSRLHYSYIFYIFIRVISVYMPLHICICTHYTCLYKKKRYFHI